MEKEEDGLVSVISPVARDPALAVLISDDGSEGVEAKRGILFLFPPRSQVHLHPLHAMHFLPFLLQVLEEILRPLKG